MPNIREIIEALRREEDVKCCEQHHAANQAYNAALDDVIESLEKFNVC